MSFVLVESEKTRLVAYDFLDDQGRSVKGNLKLQSVRFESGDGVSFSFDLRIRNDARPYAPGKYYFDMDSFGTLYNGLVEFVKYPIFTSEPVNIVFKIPSGDPDVQTLRNGEKLQAAFMTDGVDSFACRVPLLTGVSYPCGSYVLSPFSWRRESTSKFKVLMISRRLSLRPVTSPDEKSASGAHASGNAGGSERSASGAGGRVTTLSPSGGDKGRGRGSGS